MLLQLGFPQEYVVTQLTGVCLVLLDVSGQGSLGAKLFTAGVAAKVESIGLVASFNVPHQCLSVGKNLVTLTADLKFGVLLGLDIFGEKGWLVVLCGILFHPMELFFLFLLCLHRRRILGWDFF